MRYIFCIHFITWMNKYDSLEKDKDTDHEFDNFDGGSN